MQFIDLHTHSQASDGTDSPGQLVRNAQMQGLAAVAVTDHDTVSGLDEAEAAARDLGLEFVRCRTLCHKYLMPEAVTS